jgi:hypothetical protein
MGHRTGEFNELCVSRGQEWRTDQVLCSLLYPRPRAPVQRDRYRIPICRPRSSLGYIALVLQWTPGHSAESPIYISTPHLSHCCPISELSATMRPLRAVVIPRIGRLARACTRSWIVICHDRDCFTFQKRLASL